MDFTDDICMNMFTKGQRKRARILFEAGWPKKFNSQFERIKHFRGEAATLPDFYPKWYACKGLSKSCYILINIYFDYDQRWKGKKMQILDISGRIVMSKIINSKIETIDVSRLTPGVYFIRAEKEEEKLHAKFVKL